MRPFSARATFARSTAIVGALVATLAACSTSGDQPTPVPAPSGSTDGGPADASVPGFTAPPWMGKVPYPGEWRAVPRLPAGCGVRLTTTATPAIPPLSWTPCADEPDDPECREASLLAGLRDVKSTFHEDDRGVHLWFDFVDGLNELSVMWNAEGPMELAAFSADGVVPESCSLTVGSSIRGYELRVGVGVRDDRSHVALAHAWAIRAPHDDPFGTTVTTLSTALEGTSVPLRPYGDDFVYTDDRIVPLEDGPSNPRRDEAISLFGEEGAATLVVPVAGGVVAVDRRRRDVVFVPSDGEDPAVIVPIDDDRSVSHLAIDPASGDLVRIETIADDPASSRVFVSPLATTPAGAVSRLLARIWTPAPGRESAFAINAGYLFMDGPSPDRSIVVRLADGAYWQVPTAADEAAVFVSEDYVWTKVAPSGAERAWKLRRRPFPAGAPTPARL